MSAPSRVVRSWALMPSGLRVAVFTVTVVALGVGSAAWFRPEGSTLAVWWPVAGLGVAAVLVSTGRERWVMLGAHLVATAIGNHLGGQPLGVAALLGVANAVQVATVVGVLHLGTDDPRRFHDLTDLGRLLIAVAAGAASIAVMTASITAVLLDASFSAVFLSAAPSHASALVLIVPLVARGLPAAAEAGGLEQLGQWLVVTTVTIGVFLPEQHAPVHVLVIAALLWGALRAPVRAVCVQLVSAATIAAALTLQLGGPFVQFAGATPVVTRATIIQLQLMLVTAALITLSLVLVVANRREVVADLRARDAQIHAAFERSLVGMIQLGVHGPAAQAEARIEELNAPAADLLDAAPVELVGQVLASRFVAGDAEELALRCREVADGARASWQGELALAAGEEPRWVRVSIVPGAGGGRHPELVVQLLDITSQRQRLLAMTQLALRDGLTGLANRVLLDDRFAQALAEARRSGSRIGVMVLDLDSFKHLNDAHGHAAGDEALRVVAVRLRQAVREGDTVARIGGDEFVVLLPDLRDELELTTLRDRVAAIGDLPIDVPGAQVSVGLSVGAVIGRGSDDPTALLRAADERMYEDKRRRVQLQAG